MKKTVLLVCLLVSPVLGQTPYSLTPLGDLPGGSFYSSARGMNDLGQVVGQSNGDEAFIWDSTYGMQSLKSLIGNPPGQRGLRYQQSRASDRLWPVDLGRCQRHDYSA